jgi:hypothetical protein
MKKFVVTSTLLVIALILMTAFRIYQKAQARNLETRLSSYNMELIPAYKKRAEFVLALMNLVKVNSTQVTGIAVHSKDWRADSLQDIRDIDELNTHLDTNFAPVFVQIREQFQRSEKVQILSEDIIKSENRIRDIRTKLLVAQNRRVL